MKKKYNLTRSQRKRRYGSRWRVWKAHQRKTKAGKGKIRHHVGSKVRVISRKRHGAIHRKSGTAGGRPRKRT